MAADQRDQQLPGVPAHPQRDMAQATAGLAVAIDRPIGAGQIRFDRCHQGINARIQHRTVVEIHDPVAAPAVVAAAHRAVLESLQRNDGPVAVAERLGRRQHWLHRMRETADALQRVHHRCAFPLGLGIGRPVLQGAAAALAGQDAGFTPAIGAGLNDRVELRQPMTPSFAHQPGGDPLPRQCPRHEHHGSATAADPLAVVAQIVDEHVAALAHSQFTHVLPAPVWPEVRP